MRLPLFSAVLSTALIVAACDEAPTSADATDPIDDDVAEVVADAAIEDLAVMTATLPAGALGVARGPFGDRAGLGDRASHERSREVTFFDVDGNEQDAYDALLTASVHVVSSLEGQISRGAFTGSFARSRDMVVTGLEGDETERTWNGTGVHEVSRTHVSDARGTRSYDMEAQAEIDDVVRAVDRTAHPWPLSGSITRHVELVVVNGPHGDVEIERTTVLTFDGTQYATLTVDGETYEVDLAARQSDRATRQHDRP